LTFKYIYQSSSNRPSRASSGARSSIATESGKRRRGRDWEIGRIGE
jgi:hypothetical protein